MADTLAGAARCFLGKDGTGEKRKFGRHATDPSRFSAWWLPVASGGGSRTVVFRHALYVFCTRNVRADELSSLFCMVTPTQPTGNFEKKCEMPK